jgi:hypothetical protein
MTKENQIVETKKRNSELSISENAITPLFERCIANVRDEMRDNPYIVEGLKVLPVGGYRSAIGSFWNAVVDDLRNKIIARSLDLFNKSVTVKHPIKTYEDFQNIVNDDDLIEGAYKIGVIGWEASKVLRHAKETRHIFDGHPRSSEPSIIKVLAMMEDCVKYVLNAEYPVAIIDIDTYIANLGNQNFDRNPIGIENALSDLPEIYKTELANRLFTAYVRDDTPSTVRSNIEFILPILWNVLPKEAKIQIVHRVDTEIKNAIITAINYAFTFVKHVGGARYLSANARKYAIKPLVEQLMTSLDQWKKEDSIVSELQPYADVIPQDILSDYVSALTHTYVGYVGGSYQFARTDFYANGACLLIPDMFKTFDDRTAKFFVACVKNSRVLRSRIEHPQKFRRLRSLAHIVSERISESFDEKDFLNKLIDPTREDEFFEALPRFSDR